MRYQEYTGPHDAAGRRQGERLRAENRPFRSLTGDITPERRAYAEACLPIYKREAPALLDELRGLAEGARAPFLDAAAFLLGMYAFPGGNRCTCFAVNTGEDVLFGRNSDFLTALEPLYAHCEYRLEGAYAFAGNTTAFCEMEDGVNRHGLAVGMTFVYPTVRKPGLNAGYLVRLLLETCRTVEEALETLSRLTIGTAQTLTLADPTGALAVVECCAAGTAVRRPEPGENFVAAVNDFREPALSPYRCDLEDDLCSGLRGQTVRRALRERRVQTLDDACALLAGRYGFLCQYDRAQGFDTVWSTACGLRSRRLLLCEGNPSRAAFTKLPFPADPRAPAAKR